MWVLAMFDLPTTTKEERKAAGQFRKLLQSEGLFMMQFSIYARFCDNSRLTETVLRRIQSHIPPAGEVRLVYLTDKQYSEMKIFESAKTKKPEQEPEQLLLF